MINPTIEKRRNLIKLILILVLANATIKGLKAQTGFNITQYIDNFSYAKQQFRPSSMDIIQDDYSITLNFSLVGVEGNSGDYFVWYDGQLIEQGFGTVGNQISVYIETNQRGVSICGSASKKIKCGARLNNQTIIIKDGCIVVIGSPCLLFPTLEVQNGF